MKIQLFKDTETAAVRARLREIFFLSADPKNVSTDEAKNEAFFNKWTGYYFTYRPEWILVCTEGEDVLAYLMCEPDSRKALDYYEKVNPSYALFADLFNEFPAHLHMNAHPSARGRGAGTQLLDDLAARLKKGAVPGVHLITSPQQRNVHFYRKNGFTHEVEREWKGFPLLFMGRRLD